MISAFQFDDDAVAFAIDCQQINPILDVLRGLNFLPQQEQLLANLFEERDWTVGDVLLEVIAFGYRDVRQRWSLEKREALVGAVNLEHVGRSDCRASKPAELRETSS